MTTLNQAVDEKVPAGMLLTMQLDGTGHTAALWDMRDEASMAEVNELFNKLVKDNGYTAYAVRSDGEMEAGVKDLDVTTTEKVVFAPGLQGG